MKNQSVKNHYFLSKLSLKLAGSLVAAGFALLWLRLFHLQVWQGDRYQVLADANRFFYQPVPAPRGVLLDRYGNKLAVNKKVYFSQADQDAIYSQADLITREEALQLMAVNPAQVKSEYRRYYLYPQALAHTLGYIGPVGQAELERYGVKMSDWTGKLGLEKQFEGQLKGLAGTEVYEVDTWGKKQRIIQQQPEVPGQDLATTIDPYLSEVAFRAMGDKTGALVILDASNSEVLALVSTPGFSANDFSFKLDDSGAEQERQQRLQSYFSNDQRVFFNRAVSGHYPPGSVFKMVTALAGLESQALDANKSVLDEGILRVGDYEYANWYYTQYGRTEGAVDLNKAIARSNDIYFYKAAEWIGPEKLAQQARHMGLGEITGIELKPEAPGLVPDPAWKEKELGERWYLGNTYHMGIGQGDILVTPVQVGQMTQAIANDAQMCLPHLINDKERRSCKGLSISQDSIDQVLRGMVGACSSGGTAYPLFKFNQRAEEKSAASDLSLEQRFRAGGIACKTGTAEFGGADERGYRQTHGWLTAIAGIDLPQLEERYQQLGCEQQLIELRKPAAGLTSTDDLQGEDLEYCHWLSRVVDHGFPQKLVMVSLVESDEAEPYREGSADAAPVVEAVLDWIYQN